MHDAGAAAVMLVGEAGAVLDLAGSLARTPRARLSVDAAGPAMSRLDLCGATPPVAVTLSLDMELVRARLCGTGAGEPDVIDRLVGHTLAEVEDALILRTLAVQRGDRNATAAMLGIPPHRLRARLEQIGDHPAATAAAPGC